jgi:hypothetical protein
METLPAAVDARYLTEVLQRSGALPTGRVREVTVQDARNTLLSAIVRLRLVYEGDAPAAPRTLILKTLLPERQRLGWNAGQQEVAFYAKVAPQTPAGLLPQCFDAVSSADGMAWHLLLEDLADTHFIVTAWPLPPGMQDAARIVQARARFQAAWWDHPALGVSIGEWTTPGEIDGVVARFGEKFSAFADRVGDVLTPERRQFYERLVADTPRLYGRYLAKRNMTLVHGDGHFWNCFLAKDGSGVKFFDWDCWRADVGTDDLANMIAMHWYPDRRHRFESTLLDLYHETLVAQGVRGYDRRALGDDYRLSVLWQAMTPVWQAGIDLPAQIWWNNFERIMAAVDDLGCRELLS